jgi:hypothetical protein
VPIRRPVIRQIQLTSPTAPAHLSYRVAAGWISCDPTAVHRRIFQMANGAAALLLLAPEPTPAFDEVLADKPDVDSAETMIEW